ncbi:hypothetical protein [Dolichospermum phage Dfl-JY45]
MGESESDEKCGPRGSRRQRERASKTLTPGEVAQLPPLERLIEALAGADVREFLAAPDPQEPAGRDPVSGSTD